MKLEVGMYVRTEKGIAKIKKIFPDGSEPYYEAKYETDTYLEIYYDSQYVSEYDVLKASYNITDLISRFDLVNGHLVICKMYEDEKDIPTIVKCVGDCYFEEKDIKSIVTKEQFSSMEYRLGDDKLGENKNEKN